MKKTPKPRRPRTHCKRGHRFTPENTHVESRVRGGRLVVYRSCLICNRAKSRERHARNRAGLGDVPRSKGTCRRGHAMTPFNTTRKGECRECIRRGREQRAKAEAAGLRGEALREYLALERAWYDYDLSIGRKPRRPRPQLPAR